MIPVDLIALCTFVVVMLLGVMGFVLQDMRKQRPDARIQARVREAFPAGGLKSRDSRHDLDLFAVSHHDNIVGRWLGPKIARLRTVAGANGLRVVIVTGIVAELAALLMSNLLPLADIVKPALVIGLPVLGVTQSYRFLVERFKRRFLEGFPELLDLIVRAVRSGVPVTHVMGLASNECPEPLKSEFRLMGDALKVGLDLEEVLDTAVARIGIADFSFFSVCLLLQRETGGQLGETLENLAGIVRKRREIRQKTKALTGEARITTKILAAIPFLIMASLYAFNRPYLMILFDTAPGHKVLMFAAFALVIGLSVVHKMSKLDTSR